MKEKVFFAVDLGATSGRTIAASLEQGKLILNEISRFPNYIIEMQGHCYWDLPALYREIIAGLREARRKGYEIIS
ncbi:MAG: rhamnulokinase, partial [Muribaculaceae bacterium]|nr:rhamnulokinase [Muribaculaceae bacterium]